MKMPSLSIRWKLLGGFVGLALLVLLVVLFAVSRILENRIRNDINAEFREAGKVFEQLRDARFRQLHQTATLVAEMPYMKAAISTGDVNTVNNHIRQELVNLLQFDPLLPDSMLTSSIASSVDSVGLVMIFDREGVPLGQLSEGALPNSPMRDLAGVSAALQGKDPEQSHIWERNGNYFSVITIPVFIQNQVIAALSLGYPIRNTEAELLAQLIQYDVSYFVNNQLLATSISRFSSPKKANFAKHINQNVLADEQTESGGSVEIAFEGEQWLVYALPMVEMQENEGGISGYYTITQSLTNALSPLRDLQQVIYLIGFGGIIIAIVLGITLTNNLTRPINLLLDGIKRIENDDYGEPVEVVSRDEFGQLTRTFNKLVSNIRENLQEKETLLAEIHHRVKNNLAVISGLLELEGFNAENAHTEQILKNSQLRIHSMATVHEMLYRAQDFNNLSFDNFVSSLVSSIQKVYENEGSSVQIELETEPIQLNVNQAVPSGLIINELITNAFKHAYPGGESGIIKVSLIERHGAVYLQVKDEGVGLPDDFDIQTSESLGFTLINILTDQIEASIDIKQHNGTDISVNFEKQDKKGASSSMSLN